MLAVSGGGRSREEQEDLIHALATDHTAAELTEADRAMLDYAAQLTRFPGEVRGSTVETLKANGFDDRAIHDICAVTAYYAFVNRIADGLGVELENDGG